MSYIVEQTEPADVDPFHHRVIIRPESLVPDFDLETSGDNESRDLEPGLPEGTTTPGTETPEEGEN